jgi:hypothetical protein
MALATKLPVRFAGACVNSGNVNTGEQNQTYGGGQSATIFSGMVSGVNLLAAPFAIPNTPAQGADVQFVSGGGRLKDILINGLASGQACVFYDAALATSGGPFVASGHKVLGVIPAGTVVGAVFGNPQGITAVPGQVIALDMPFNSGLCCNLRSGIPGFTVSWTPETNPQAPFIGY